MRDGAFNAKEDPHKVLITINTQHNPAQFMCTLQVNSAMLELTRVLILNAGSTHEKPSIEQDPADLISFPGKLSLRMCAPCRSSWLWLWFCQDGKNPVPGTHLHGGCMLLRSVANSPRRQTREQQ